MGVREAASADMARATAPVARRAPQATVLGSAPAVAPWLTGGGGPARGAATVLALQASVGNRQVQALLARRDPVSVQRCGVEVHDGCPCAADTAQDGTTGAMPMVSRQQPPAPAPAAGPGCTFRVPGNVLESVVASINAGTVPEAFCILNGRAMPELLNLLLAMKSRGVYAAYAGSGQAQGDPRMAAALHAVDLHTKGSPITGPELRGLIDRLGTLPADQRATILRFVGKLVTLRVRGLDLDFSYCRGASSAGCLAEVRDAIAEGLDFASVYTACGRDRRNRTGGQIESCVSAAFARRGVQLQVAGSTSASGQVTINAPAITQCQPIHVKATELHEAVHAVTVHQLERRFGRGTPAFNRAFDEASGWVADEVSARRAEVAFYREVLAALQRLERMIK